MGIVYLLKSWNNSRTALSARKAQVLEYGTDNMGEIRGAEGWFVIENLTRGYLNEVISIISDFQAAHRALDYL